MQMELRKKPHILFANTTFLKIWLAGCLSSLAISMYVLIEQWYIVHYLRMPGLLGLAMMATTLPRVVFMAFGGVMADRYKKKVMVGWSLLTRVGLLVLMAVFFHLGYLHFTFLCLFALLFGLLDAFFWPARDALLPSVLNQHQLQSANAFVQTTNQLSTVLGPVLASLLLSHVSYPIIFMCIALMLAVGALFMYTVNEPIQKDHLSTRATFIASLLEGQRYVRQSAYLKTVMLTFIVTNFFFVGPLIISIPLYGEEVYGGKSLILSLLQSSFAIGMVAGAIGIGIFNIRKHRGAAVIGLIGMEGGLLILYSQWTVLTCSIVSLFLIGVCISYVNIIVISQMQQNVPKDKIGRVMSLNTMVSMGLIPVSYGVVSLLLNGSVSLTVLLTCAGMFIIALCAWLWRYGVAIRGMQ